jgi:hypothetical protein
MGDKNINIKIGSSADGTGFNKVLGWFGQMRGGISLIAGTVAFQWISSAITGMVNFGKAAVGAFAEAERGERQLSAALKNSGDNVDRYMASYKALAAALQATTIYEDDAIIAQMAHMKQIGISADKIAEYTTAAVGLASKLQIDLPAAFDMIIKSSNGMTMTFERAAGGFKLMGTDAEKFAQVLKFARDAQSSLTADANTLYGIQQSLNIEWGNAKEKIGEYAAEVLHLKDNMKGLREIIKNINDNPTALQNFVQGYIQSIKNVTMGGIKGGAAGIFKATGENIGTMTGFLTGGIKGGLPDVGPGARGYGQKDTVQEFIAKAIWEEQLKELREIKTGVVTVSKPQ